MVAKEAEPMKPVEAYADARRLTPRTPLTARINARSGDWDIDDLAALRRQQGDWVEWLS